MSTNKVSKIPTQVWDFLEGKKTLIGSFIIFISGGFLALEKIDETTAKVAIAIGQSIAILGIRSAIQKLLEKK